MRPAGLEPTACSLEANRSFLLIYGRSFLFFRFGLLFFWFGGRRSTVGFLAYLHLDGGGDFRVGLQVLDRLRAALSELLGGPGPAMPVLPRLEV